MRLCMERGDVGKRRVHGAPIQEVRCRHRALPIASFQVVAPDQDQPIGLAVGQRLKQNGIDFAENGGRWAEARAESKAGDRRETWILAKPARCVADVLREFLQWTNSPGIPALLFDLLDWTKPAQGDPARLLWSHSPGDIALDVFVQVIANLFVEVLFRLL